MRGLFSFARQLRRARIEDADDHDGSFFGGVIQDGGIAGGTGGNLVDRDQRLAGALRHQHLYRHHDDLERRRARSHQFRRQRRQHRHIEQRHRQRHLRHLGPDGGTSIKSLSGCGQVNLGANTLTITNGNGTFAGVIEDGGAGGGLTMAGGTETLTGANTYTGATTVNGGTLVVDGSIISATTVNAGGTLAGSGASATSL